MTQIYRLQTITAMKLKCMKQLTIEIETAIKNGWHKHEAACVMERTKMQAEVMNPQGVIDEIMRTLPGVSYGTQ